MQEIIDRLALNLSGENMGAAISGLFATGLLEDLLPSSIEIDYEKKEVTKDWMKKYVAQTRKQLKIKWETTSNQQLRFYPDDHRIWIHIECRYRPQEVITFLEKVDFSLASFSNLYDEWPETDSDYIAPSFGNGHYPHGWACAFKGKGHDQLVSRRWLAYGPWKFTRGKNDLSFIQFHELAVSAEDALREAKTGHNMMGISDDGGFIQNGYVFEFPVKGAYDAKLKLLKVIVHGQTLKPKQLLDYSAARLYNVTGIDKPLERIGFVFMEEDPAKKYLQMLWLRNMECYAIIGGNEVRLDDGNYEPGIKKPSWTL